MKTTYIVPQFKKERKKESYEADFTFYDFNLLPHYPLVNMLKTWG